MIGGGEGGRQRQIWRLVSQLERDRGVPKTTFLDNSKLGCGMHMHVCVCVCVCVLCVCLCVCTVCFMYMHVSE